MRNQFYILQGKTPEALDAQALMWLETRGHPVGLPVYQPERPWEFCKRMGITRRTLHRKMRQASCPRIEVERGPSGRRIVWLKATEAFERFVRRR